MDLMKQSTSFAQLKKKYRNFAAPTVEIYVDGAGIVSKMGASVTDLEVDLTCGYPASGCSFTITGEYQPSQSDFNPRGCAKKLELGAKVEVALGYITLETVFVGLITELEYLFEEEAPLIHVECMDIKCLLMKTQRLELMGESKCRQVVDELLSSAPVSSYLGGKAIEIPNDEKRPLGVSMESDYDFIVRWAQYSGCEFFVLCGKVYFRPAPGASSPILEIEPDGGILSARLRLQGTELVKSVQVVSIDPANDKVISGKASASGKFGDGPTAKKMIAGTERIYLDPLATSTSAAQARAKVLMAGLTGRFEQLELRCIGLPDLVPGRQVKVKGLSGRAAGSFYITDIRHSFGLDGFTTTLEARRNSL